MPILKRTGRPRPRGILALVVIVAALAGCGSATVLTSAAPAATASANPTAAATSASSAASASLPTGWTRTSVAADGYSIGTPKDWSAVPIGGQDIDAIIADFKTSNPELAGILQQAKDSGQTFSFMAITTDPTVIGSTGFAPNVNVLITPNQGYDAAFIATANVIQLKKLTSVEGDVVDTAVALPADANAHRLRYHLKATASLTTVATLYILTHGTKAFNITISAVDSQMVDLEDEFAAIAQSFTLLAP